MSLLLTGGAVFRDGKFQNMDISIDQGRIVSVSPSLPREGASVIELLERVFALAFVRQEVVFGE